MDPINNIDPAVAAQGRRYAQQLEDGLLLGRKLWADIKNQGRETKFYIVGPKGNKADEVAEALMDGLGYTPAPDGTLMLMRTWGKEYPPIQYHLVDTEPELEKLCKEQGTDAVTVFKEDEEKYRNMETKLLKDFAEYDTKGYPSCCIVGESAVTRPENIEIIKSGFTIWLQCTTISSWRQTQKSLTGASGLYIPGRYMAKPPIWALAQEMECDVDNEEFAAEYTRILEELEPEYEKLADVSLYTDTQGISENAHWALPKLVKMISEGMGIKAASEDADDESIEKELTDFLEGARLSKYLEDALKWCEEQGAASIEDIVENPEDFSEAMGLKPLEKKRFVRACEGAVA